MSKAFKCERCRKLYSKSPCRIINGDLIPGQADDNKIDICEECWGKLDPALKKWWYGDGGRKPLVMSGEYDDSRVYTNNERQLDCLIDCQTTQGEPALRARLEEK
jgi:hypothetical protein